MSGSAEALAALTLNVPYNDLAAVERLFAENKDKIAAVIVEPVAANMGVVLPKEGFLKGLRDLTRKHGALLIIDEVITGFRLHNGSAQQLFGVQGDLTTMGKIIGGGVPVAAYGGSAELMNHVGAGDRAWVQLYGKSFDEFRLDPQGIAIDRDFNAQTFRNARELQLKSPDFLVAHFTAPDHQAHGTGIQSSRYARHIRQFDGELFDWLDSLTPDWTVVVTSDHGAADSGTHGTDTALQRRCPIAAWGPGIIAGGQAPRTLDQVEMPGLFEPHYSACRRPSRAAVASPLRGSTQTRSKYEP